MDKEHFGIRQFENLLDSYGANPAAWPPALRAAALALVAGEPVAKRLLEEASALDAALDALPAAPVPAGLQARIMANLDAPAPQFRLERGLQWLSAALWRPLALGALPLLFGFSLGMGDYQDTSELEDTLALLVFSEVQLMGFGEELDYEQ